MRLIISVCIGLFMAGSIVTAAQAADMGLACAWLFNEGSGTDISDSVGGNNGEIQGNLKWTDGLFGKALEFPGAGDSYVSIPHDDVHDADPYTITAWVKLESVSWQYIAWKNGLTWPEPHAKRHIDIWIYDGSNIAVIMWAFEGGGANYGRVDGVTPVANGDWHHVAKSSDGEMMRLFIDGKLDGEAPTGGKLVVNGEDPLWIGARPGDVAATGIIDEVGFFTTALDEAQLKTVMDQGLETLAPVEALHRITTTWGSLKVD